MRLGDILKLQSHKDNYGEMHSYIIKSLKEMTGVKYHQDNVGNIYAKKGDDFLYPAFACRTDSSQSVKESFNVTRIGKSQTWMAYRKKDDGKIERIGIGGDAKCGVYLCLKLLTKLKTAKCVFFVKAEEGFFGAKHSDTKFFQDCRWLIEFDRKGHKDMVVTMKGNDVASLDFKNSIEQIGNRFGRSIVYGGGMTDVGAVKMEHNLRISVANISSGFFNPRGDKEIIIGKYVNSTLEFCERIAQKMIGLYPHARATILLPGGVKQLDAPVPVTENTNNIVRRVIPVGKNGQYCSTPGCKSLLNLGSTSDKCMLCLSKVRLFNDSYHCQKCKKTLEREIELANGYCNYCKPIEFFF